MYVYYKDKNDTIRYIELKGGALHRFDKPVFVFKILQTRAELLDDQFEYFLSGLNPYEQAYTSDNLNLEFEIQEHMFTMKEVRNNKIPKIKK